MESDNTYQSWGGITYGHKGAFWAGIWAVIVGVILHLPMYLKAHDVGYRLVGTPMDLPMKIGMVLIVLGMILTLYGLLPKKDETDPDVLSLKVRALDDAPIRGSHIALLLVMAAAVTIDVMKPTTLSFVIPGMTEEYGLKSPLNPDGTVPAALLPLSGITGTVLGSFLWGWLGDRIGRRASILLAAVSFIGTSICGSMPTYAMNVFMCFIMGFGVGGMLPIMYTIMAETIPARHRGWIMVLIGGDVVGAYILTSWLAAELVPVYSWRILWLIGLPTGIFLIFLNRWIPESPRYLLTHGRNVEAKAVMERFGAKIVEDKSSKLKVEQGVKDRMIQLFQPPFSYITAAVLLLALGVGLVSFGFQLWIPSNLQKMGFTEAEANYMLRDSALIGFPLNFLIAWLYGFWSSKRTLILLSGLTALSLFGFTLAGEAIASNQVLLYALLVMPIWGISSIVSVLSAYCVEIYPTRLRSRGSGLGAGFSKAGGVLIIGLVAISVAPPSIAGTALTGAVPMALAAMALVFFGIETHKRQLEDITVEQLKRWSFQVERGE
ncbi:MFS transporter, putative metabolite:H+ symporter [Fodinibius roseus]|uniref:MFS transporter, putative metabolite:H+ symporter n=1 Tax=Fodinibius roseus TaxID=1194090 RepID=A0A1M5HTI6_9BACT|nr:MFS transporter [Fodinibius roseus]SHG19274.1 MFS transporter, putative metabolite:H+ symporter [Fodinibius roseus]